MKDAQTEELGMNKKNEDVLFVPGQKGNRKNFAKDKNSKNVDK